MKTTQAPPVKKKGEKTKRLQLAHVSPRRQVLRLRRRLHNYSPRKHERGASRPEAAMPSGVAGAGPRLRARGPANRRAGDGVWRREAGKPKSRCGVSTGDGDGDEPHVTGGGSGRPPTFPRPRRSLSKVWRRLGNEEDNDGPR
jgi:hypothetical protein